MRQSLSRASVNFKAPELESINDLKIENDRLKTTLTVLNQKMKSQQDLEKTIEQLNIRNSELEEKNATLSQEIASQTQKVEYLTEKQKELVNKLDRCEEQKERIKDDADSLN